MTHGAAGHRGRCARRFEEGFRTMPKLLLVALPVLLAALVVTVLMLLRRTPSRHAINVWSSLLLIAYVGTTAGLGIFWVANQQLPVFDWHYLFGYTTVVLVVLHLSFNFPVAWRYLTRPRNATAATTAASGSEAGAGRRRVLGALGVLLALGAAFALGMRHGRSELRIEWPGSRRDATGPDPSQAGNAAVGADSSAALDSSAARAGFRRTLPCVLVALAHAGAAARTGGGLG